jgi:hypothetical protein
MIRSCVVRFKALAVFAVLLSAVSIISCAESVEGGASCPMLCPQEPAPLRDTIVDAVIVDTSIAGFPPLGFEQALMLAKLGDTLETRVIVRFDSLPTTYRFGTVDSTIVRIDSAYIRGIVPAADTGLKFRTAGTIEVYDVTDAAVDTAVGSLAAEFTAANMIGSFPYLVDDSPDTVTILLDTARVRSRIVNGQRLRVGFRLVSAGSDKINFISQQTGEGFVLSVHPSRDTSVRASAFAGRSLTPTDLEYLRIPLSDFVIPVVGALPTDPQLLRVGGFPARRVLLRFDIPSRIVDSTVVIRATLMLTQRPTTTTGQSGDTVTLQVVPVLVSNRVTDPREMLDFAASPISFPLDSLRLVPNDSALRELQLVALVRAWRGQDTIKTPRVAALFLNSEARSLGGIDFFSLESPVAVRPRLRITYVTRLSSGRP